MRRRAACVIIPPEVDDPAVDDRYFFPTSAPLSTKRASALPETLVQLVQRLVAIRLRRALQIDPSVVGPCPHQIEPVEQRHARHRRDLLHHALIRIEVGIGAQEPAELRIDQHQVAARVAHTFGAGVQHVQHAVRLQATHCLHRAGLPQHQRIVLLLQRRIDQRQHVLGRHAAAAAHRETELHRRQCRVQRAHHAPGERAALRTLLVRSWSRTRLSLPSRRREYRPAPQRGSPPKAAPTQHRW